MVKTKLLLLPAAAVLFSISTIANAVQIPGVYNTGLGVGGVALAPGDNQVDANYTITATTDPNVVVGAQARTYYNPAYLMDGPLSRIVNGTGDGNGTAGASTTFSTTFSLAGFDAANATISGQVLFDNFGEIFLNGNQIGGTFTGFNSLTPFGTNAAFFNGGLNTLSFVLRNDTGPQAFQVAGLTVTAELLAAVPEPASWAMMIMGFGLMGASMRKRAARTPVVAA